MSIAVMIALQRSGTHALGSAIDQHPEIAYAKEVFHPEYSQSRYGYYNFLPQALSKEPDLALPANAQRRYAEFMAFLKSRAEKPVTLIDVKYSSTHHFNGDWHPLSRRPQLLDLLAGQKIPILHLCRKNLVRVVTSGLLAEATSIYRVKSTNEIPVDRIRVKPEHFLARVRFLETEQTLMSQFLKTYPEIIELEYTGLFKGDGALTSKTARQIEELLGVSYFENYVPIYLKQAQRPLEDTIINFDELAVALKRTPYASMLSEP